MEIKAFLAHLNLGYDEDIDHSFILAITKSSSNNFSFGYVIKCLAVDEEYQGL